MPTRAWCPLCGERVDGLIEHLRSPAGEGCPHTPAPVQFPEPDASPE